MAQLQLIQSRCDALAEAQAELGACRRGLLAILEEELNAIEQQRYELLEASALEEDDGEAAEQGVGGSGGGGGGGERVEEEEYGEEGAPTLEMQLHDLGLLAAHVESEIASLTEPPPSDLIGLALDFGRRFGKELSDEAAEDFECLRLLSEELGLSEEEMARRHAALQREIDILSSIAHPDANSSAPTQSDGDSRAGALVLSSWEEEMQQVSHEGVEPIAPIPQSALCHAPRHTGLIPSPAMADGRCPLHRHRSHTRSSGPAGSRLVDAGGPAVCSAMADGAPKSSQAGGCGELHGLRAGVRWCCLLVGGWAGAARWPGRHALST